MSRDLDQAIEELNAAELVALARARAQTTEGQTKLLQLSQRCIGTNTAKKHGFRFELSDGRLEVFRDRTSIAVWLTHNAELQLFGVDNQISYSTGDIDDAVLKTAQVLQIELKKALDGGRGGNSYLRTA